VQFFAFTNYCIPIGNATNIRNEYTKLIGSTTKRHTPSALDKLAFWDVLARKLVMVFPAHCFLMHSTFNMAFDGGNSRTQKFHKMLSTVFYFALANCGSFNHEK